MDIILIIEDDVEINTLLTDFLKENGYVVYSQYDGLHVLDFLHKEKIDLLRLGADDYITKPFDMEEVLARIESNLRRVQFENRSAACLQYGDLCLALDGNVGASVQDNNLKIILEL